MEDVLVGILASDDENTIAGVVMKVKDHYDDVVVIDNGSEDSTARLAERAGAQVLRHEKPKGKREALKKLFRYARQKGTDVLVTLEGGGGYPEEEIPDLVSKISGEAADIVVGSRFLKSGSWVSLSEENKSAEIDSTESIKLSEVDVRSDLRAYSKRALKKIELEGEESEVGDWSGSSDSGWTSDEILEKGLENGLDVLVVPADISHYGKPSQKTVKHSRKEEKGPFTTYFDDKNPLLIFGIPSIAAFVLGVVTGVIATLRWYGNGPLSLEIVVLSFVFFVIGIVMGILALYLDKAKDPY